MTYSELWVGEHINVLGGQHNQGRLESSVPHSSHLALCMSSTRLFLNTDYNKPIMARKSLS